MSFLLDGKKKNSHHIMTVANTKIGLAQIVLVLALVYSHLP